MTNWIGSVSDEKKIKGLCVVHAQDLSHPPSSEKRSFNSTVSLLKAIWVCVVPTQNRADSPVTRSQKGNSNLQRFTRNSRKRVYSFKNVFPALIFCQYSRTNLTHELVTEKAERTVVFGCPDNHKPIHLVVFVLFNPECSYLPLICWIFAVYCI